MNASGAFSISTQRGGQAAGAPPVVVRQGRIGREAVKRLYAQVLGCRFFGMESSYWNRRVVDGGAQRLAVKAGGRSHKVTVHHYQVTRFNAIVSALKREGGGKINLGPAGLPWGRLQPIATTIPIILASPG